MMGTNSAVNKIEVHHVTMLQDLRGRIGRCDNYINKHTKDIAFLYNEIKRLEGALYGTREKMLTDLHRLEAEVISLSLSSFINPLIHHFLNENLLVLSNFYFTIIFKRSLLQRC